MIISIDLDDNVPVYRQIINQIQNLLIEGKLGPKDPLPPIRQLATDLELNPNTVAKAYSILESERLIFSAGRKGTFVAADALDNLKNDLERNSKRQIKSIMYELQSNGYDKKAFKKMIDELINELRW
ncbi:MAG: GntR family transcriptional regulator [Deltaproteobacteria bacterium]|nr:MAG: GntR family transcriptional regulator [Deltaproteobacteria bacterium]